MRMKKILTLVTLLLGIYCAQAQTNAGLSASKSLGDPTMFFSDAGPQVKTKADASSFAGGSGTEADPYLIATKEHLRNLGALSSDDSGTFPQKLKGVYFKQIADITFEEDDPMTFIGNGAWFSGTYDGNGYTIKNYTLKYNTQNASNGYMALFVNCVESTLKNIRMVGTKIDIDVEGTGYSMMVAGLVGNFQYGKIVNCTTEGSYNVRAGGTESGSFFGGLVSYLSYSTIDNCRSYGNCQNEVVLKGGSCFAEVAGIVTEMYDSKLVNCISYLNAENQCLGNLDVLDIRTVRTAGITAFASGSQVLNSCSRGKSLVSVSENKQQDGTSYIYTAGLVSVMTDKSLLLNGWSVVSTLKNQAVAESYVDPICCAVVEESTFDNCYYLLENEESEAAMKSQKFVDKLNENLPEDALTWQFRKDDYPALQALHTVTLPLLTGATTTPGEGASAIENGERFRFSLVLEEEYNQSKPVVTVGDKTLEPDANMNYVTEPVTADMVVKIDGIVKNTETANEEINASVQKVYVADGILYIQPEATAQVNVFNMQGQLVKSTLVSSEAQIQLPQGLYIVRLNDQSYKVLISE